MIIHQLSHRIWTQCGLTERGCYEPSFLAPVSKITSLSCLYFTTGTLRTYSSSSTCHSLIETNATYPGGNKQRQTTSSHHCLTCMSCDPSGKREVCTSDYCVHLADGAVFMFSDNGTLRKTLPLNPLTCPPWYLHPSTVSENLIFIVCHPTSAGQSRYLEHDDYTEQFPTPTTVSGSSLIFAKGYDVHDIPRNLFLYLSDNQIFFEMLSDSAAPTPLSSPPECDTLTMLHPRAARGNEIQFWLDCTTESNVTKRFNVIMNRPEGSPTFTELYDTMGVPTDSPNGNYVAIRHDNSLTIYNTSNLQQYPGTKTFAGRIQRIDFLSADQLLVVVPGQNHTLVNITVFVQSDGTRGVAELPSTVAYCSTGGSCLPHKLIDRYTLLVFTRNGNVYDALFCTTSDPIQCLGAVQRIHERPQVAFFNTLPAANPLPPPPTTILPTPTLLTPTPAVITSSSYGTSLSSDPPPTTPQTSSATATNQVEPSPTQLSPLSTSSILPPSTVLIVPSSLPLDPTPTGSGSQRMTPAVLTVTIIASILFVITAVLILAASIFVIQKRKERAHWLQCCSHTMAPVQETPINQPRDIVGAEIPTIVTSPPNSHNEIQLVIYRDPSSSGYSSMAHSVCPTPTDRLSSASADGELSHLRDQATPPDGSSQNGDMNTIPAPSSPTVPTMHRSEQVF